MLVKLHISQSKVGTHTQTHTRAHPPTPIQIGGVSKHAESNLIKTSLSWQSSSDETHLFIIVITRTRRYRCVIPFQITVLLLIITLFIHPRYPAPHSRSRTTLSHNDITYSSCSGISELHQIIYSCHSLSSERLVRERGSGVLLKKYVRTMVEKREQGRWKWGKQQRCRDDRLFGADSEYRREIITLDLPTGLAAREDLRHKKERESFHWKKSKILFKVPLRCSSLYLDECLCNTIYVVHSKEEKKIGGDAGLELCKLKLCRMSVVNGTVLLKVIVWWFFHAMSNSYQQDLISHDISQRLLLFAPHFMLYDGHGW